MYRQIQISRKVWINIIICLEREVISLVIILSLDLYSQFRFHTHCFVLEELGELVSSLISMCIALPVVRHVVDMSQDNPQQLLRTKHHVLIWDK